MTNIQQPKVPMHAVKNLPDPGASTATQPTADSEVFPRARRRTFSNADKRRILQAADNSTKPGDRRADAPRGRVFVVSEHLAPPARSRR
jgi:hypothetical protein